MIYLGIDVSKLKLDCTLLLDPDNDKRKTKVVANSRVGVREPIRWCVKHGVDAGQVHAVLEATGPYHEQAATTLHDNGVALSIANPANVRDSVGRWPCVPRRMRSTAWSWLATV